MIGTMRVQDSAVLGVACDDGGRVREPIHYTPVSSHMLASTRVTGLTSSHLMSMIAMSRTVLDGSKDPTRGAHEQAAAIAAAHEQPPAQPPSDAPTTELPRPAAPPADTEVPGAMFHSVPEVMAPPADFTLGSTYGSITTYALPSTTVSSCATGGAAPAGVHVVPGEHSIGYTSNMTAHTSTVTGIFGHNNSMFGNPTIPESEEIFSIRQDSAAAPVPQAGRGPAESEATEASDAAEFGGAMAGVPSYLVEGAGVGSLPWEHGRHEETDLPLTKPCVSQMLLDGEHGAPPLLRMHAMRNICVTGCTAVRVYLGTVRI